MTTSYKLPRCLRQTEGIHKTVDPKKKTFRKRKENKEAYFGRLLDRDEQRVISQFQKNKRFSCIACAGKR